MHTSNIGRRTVLAAGLGGLMISVAGCGNNSDDPSTYPNDTIELIVPYSAGGASDAMARMMEPTMAKNLGTSIVVQNRGGGSGSVAHGYAKNEPADGYTLLSTSTSLLTTTPLMQNVNYDPAEDFVSVGGYADANYILVAPADSPYKTIEELAGASGRLTYGNSSPGVVPHRAGALFAQKAGLDAETVPYEGAGDAVAALLGKQVDFYVGEMPLVVPQIESGDLRAFAITSAERYENLPDIPTFAELGYEDCTLSASYGFIVRKGTPDEIVEKLRGALEEATSTDEWKKYAEENYFIQPPASNEEWLSTELAKTDDAKRDLDMLGLLKDS